MPEIVLDQPTGDPLTNNKSGYWEGPYYTTRVFGSEEIVLSRFGFLNNFEMKHIWVVFELPLESYDEVESCFIRFCFYNSTPSPTTMYADITAHRVVNTDAPTSRADCVYQVGTNPTIATVAWERPPSGAFLQFDYTPDIKSIIDEIKALDGWVKGNRIALYITIRQEFTPYPNPNYRIKYVNEYDLGLTVPLIPNDTNLLPKLILNYTPGVPGSETDSHDVVSELTIEQIVQGRIIGGRLEHTLEIIQEYVTSVSRNRELESELEFTQLIHVAGDKEVSVISDLFIIQSITRSHVRPMTVEHTLRFQQEITRNAPLDKQIVHWLDIEQEYTPGKRYERSVEHTLELISDVSTTSLFRTFVHYLRFEQEITPSGDFTVYHEVVHDLVFTQTIVCGGDRERGVEHDLTFSQSILGFNVNGVCRPDLKWTTMPNKPTITPQSTITLTVGSDSITLRAPLFSDREELFLERISRKTRGGDLKVYRDEQWAKIRTFRYKFDGLDADKVLEMFQFLHLSLGLKVTLVDHEGLTWEGYIVNPQGETAQYVRQCGNTTEFDFEGVPA